MSSNRCAASHCEAIKTLASKAKHISLLQELDKDHVTFQLMIVDFADVFAAMMGLLTAAHTLLRKEDEEGDDKLAKSKRKKKKQQGPPPMPEDQAQRKFKSALADYKKLTTQGLSIGSVSSQSSQSFPRLLQELSDSLSIAEARSLPTEEFLAVMSTQMPSIQKDEVVKYFQVLSTGRLKAVSSKNQTSINAETGRVIDFLDAVASNSKIDSEVTSQASGVAKLYNAEKATVAELRSTMGQVNQKQPVGMFRIQAALAKDLLEPVQLASKQAS